MATAGYSGTPLLKKLGIKPEMKVLVINKPDDYYKLLEEISVISYVRKMKHLILFIYL